MFFVFQAATALQTDKPAPQKLIVPRQKERMEMTLGTVFVWTSSKSSFGRRKSALKTSVRFGSASWKTNCRRKLPDKSDALSACAESWPAGKADSNSSANSSAIASIVEETTWRPSKTCRFVWFRSYFLSAKDLLNDFFFWVLELFVSLLNSFLVMKLIKQQFYQFDP